MAISPPPAGRPRPATGTPAPGSEPIRSSLPSITARVLAFGSILLAGLCGGLIGNSIVELQCQGDCGAQRGLGALIGALMAAGGVAVVAVLVLRAMTEWRSIEHRQQSPNRTSG